MKSYDVLILGSGPAGLELCYMLAGTGKSVCFIEKEEKSFGGACVNYGCMPTKQQVQSAEFAWQAPKRINLALPLDPLKLI